MTQSKTILFFGNERLATGVTTNTPVLKALVLNGYKIAAIITTPNINTSSRKPRPLEVVDFAQQHDIPLIETKSLKDLVEQINSYGADAAVLASFGRMVPTEVINLFPHGIINIHPSLLPLHRGPIPIEGSILAGEKQTGVSLMSLVPEMDAGPVYDQVSIDLNGSESKQYLADTLGQLGAELLIKLLPEILSGKLKPREQKGIASYDKRLDKDRGVFDSSLSARELERQVRAFLGWPRSKATVSGLPVTITKAHVIDQSLQETGSFQNLNGELVFAANKGSLVIDSLVPASGKEMSGSEFLHGHPLQ